MRQAAAQTPRVKNLAPSIARGEAPITAKRIARLALAALLGLGACTQGENPGALRLVDTPAQLPAPLPVQAMHFVPDATPPTLTTPPVADSPNTGEVYWTASDPKTAQQLATDWGLKLSVLTELNPDIKPDQPLAQGTRLRVYQYDPENPPQSVGTPNRGKLKNGMPLPEGDAWRLRPVRRRAYGTHTTVTSLVQAFESYGERFPDGPKIRVGELAKAGGGRVAPHASHRSGRDVDIGYIFNGEDDGENRWPRMNERNFDAAKNWYLIQEILASGNVQTIYISKKLQKLLHKEAAKTLPAEQLAALFEYPRTEASPHAVLQHWRGHDDHMHVRFACEPGNRRCRSRGH